MALDIEIGTETDGWRHPEGPGSYEWWYFDGIDESTGYAFVAIFFRGIPFSGARQRATEIDLSGGEPDSADRFPAVAFSLYGPEQTEMYLVNLHQPSAMEIDEDRFGIRIARSSARFDGSRYLVEIDEQQLDTQPLRATLELEPLSLPTHRGAMRDDHVWMLAAPRCRFRLRVRSGNESRELSGIGYHDHNLGDTSLQAQFRRWEWGRAHFADRTLIYYHAVDLQEKTDSYLVSVREDGAAQVEKATFQPLSWKRNLYRLRYPSHLRIVSETESIEITSPRIVDNGPFYARMIGRFRSGDDEALGLTEMLRPRALNWRWFRPLLNTRVRPADTRDRIGRRITSWLVQKGF